MFIGVIFIYTVDYISLKERTLIEDKLINKNKNKN